MNYKQEISPNEVSGNRKVSGGFAFLSIDNTSFGSFIMKKCTKCNECKDLDEFYKDVDKIDSLQSWCKGCKSEQQLAMRRTPEGRLRRIYADQKANSKRRGDPPPSYSAEWLVAWGLSQQKYLDDHRAWKKSGYEKMLSPGVDRISDYGHYTEDNIQVMSWDKNKQKGHDDIRNGINNKISKPVRQIIITTNEVFEYPSISFAYRATGINSCGISDCCHGRRDTAGDSVWEFINK